MHVIEHGDIQKQLVLTLGGGPVNMCLHRQFTQPGQRVK